MILLLAFLSLVVLIILHELGHFLLAKRFGVKVEEFGIFLPPRLISKKIGETVYSLNLLPFGAFVKLHGETDQGRSEHWSFGQKPIWQRALIILGGVVSFWIVSAILLSIMMGLGAPTAISDEENEDLIDPRVMVMAVTPNSPAEMAGIRLGDTIRKFSIFNFQSPINKVRELQELTEKYKGEEVTLTIERGREIFEVSLVPRVSPPEGEGPMGVVLVRTAMKPYPWHQALIQGVITTVNLTLAIIQGWIETLVLAVRREPIGVELVGPVGIVGLIAQVGRLGISYFLQFIAIISVHIALFNLLPIPALDGGKLVFLGIEAVRKKPISLKTEQQITAFFFVLLIALIIWVTIHDIKRLFF